MSARLKKRSRASSRASRASSSAAAASAPNASVRRGAVTFMLINTVVWGASMPLVKPGLEITTAFLFLFERFLVAGVLTLPILLWYLVKKPQLRRTLPVIIGLEILAATALGFLYTGLAMTSAIEASLITTTTPIFTTIGGVLFLREKEERREWLGLTLAFVGTILLVVEPILSGSWQQAEFSFVGNGLVFMQNVAIAGYYLLAKKFYTGVPKLFVASTSFWIAGTFFFALSWFEAGSLPLFAQALARDLVSPPVQVAVGYMAVLGSIVGLTAYIKGQDGMEASEASLFTYLQPLIAIPASWILLGEQTTPLMLVAVLVIFLGVGIGEFGRALPGSAPRTITRKKQKRYRLSRR